MKRRIPGTQKRFLKKSIGILQRKQDNEDYGNAEWRRLNDRIRELIHKLEYLEEEERHRVVRKFRRII